jgi:hypothetical protein
MQGRKTARASALAIAISLTASVAAPATAAVYNVTTTADTVPGQAACGDLVLAAIGGRGRLRGQR